MPIQDLSGTGPMFFEIVRSVTLYAALFAIDVDFAHETRARGCPFCGGPLHSAPYERKPRGPTALPSEYSVRLSLCCGARDCRRRTLPSSCLFDGRRVYWRAVVLIAVSMTQGGPSRRSVGQICALFGVSRSTVRRWCAYFDSEFVLSRAWQCIAGQVGVRMSDELPHALLARFASNSGASEAALVSCLELLAMGRASPRGQTF